VGFRPAGTYDTVLLILAITLWGFIAFAVTARFQLAGFSAFFGFSILVIYLKHPRRREHQELDEKLPIDRQTRARMEYFTLQGVKEKLVEDQDS